MESIRENRPLMISLVGTYSFIVFLALGWSSDLCEQFGIVQFPEEVKLVISINFKNQGCNFTVQKNSLHNQYNFILFQFRSILLQVLMVDFILSLILDRICAFLFCGGKLRQPKQSC